MKVLIFFLLLSVPYLSAYADPIRCGIAEGYPPYQFQSSDQQAIGFDVDVLKLLAQHLSRPIDIKQGPWDDMVSTLTFTNKLDCIAGMEITPKRATLFEFTPSYYQRQIVVFKHAQSQNIQSLHDLVSLPITGDNDSTIEAIFHEQGLYQKIRIKRARSKEESMRLLASGTYKAMVAPKAVGLYLAKQQQVDVKIIYQSSESSPVAIAVKKHNSALHQELSEGIRALQQNQSINRLYQQWFARPISRTETTVQPADAKHL